MKGCSIEELRPGQTAETARTISESDIYQFAGVTGDLNPVHLNQQFATTTRFKTRIAHGMLTAGLVSGLLGMQLPGPGTVYLRQTLEFLAPVHIGDTITARVEVLEILPDTGRVRLATVCFNQDGKKVLDGEALVMPPKSK